MKLKNVTILLFVLILLDQILKIWVKTHMCIDEAIMVVPEWFQLRFIENNGAAFGMQISSAGGFDWGKLALSLFRVVMIGLLGYYIVYLNRRKTGTPKGVTIGLAMILAGAVGNLIDSMFYGMIFTQSTPTTVATLGEGYSTFMMGKVVDMFYFPLFQWNSVPGWLDFLVDYNNYFFGAIFNLADAYISCAVVYLIIFQYRFFQEE
ncbi:MAG: lipoprotein signal peptidase [Alistipes sp.]|nr:lipoprotein signal peptidase [Alistipes sp.]MBQ3197215.1 lipoprotein signal peptidase [Alistipes sp.]MBQ4532863.1 lipoprotein signal peptidase [Alistipes sp.]